MIVCPSCGSSHIRNDYKPTPLALRAIGIRALLCDHCNHQFRAFSPSSPKDKAPRHNKRKADVFNPAPAVDLNQLTQIPTEQNRNKPARITLTRFPITGEPQTTIAGELLEPVQSDLRTKITRLYEQSEAELAKQNRGQLQLASSSTIICPDCGSQNVKRRRRRKFERAIFIFSDHKAYICRSCDASFYAKPNEDGDDQHAMNTPDAVL